MLGSDWETVLENVRTFIGVRDAHAAGGGNRCRVTLQLTFMEINVAELPVIVKLAASLGVDRVKGHHLWVHFSETRRQSMRRNSEAIARWNNVVDSAHEVAERHRLPSGDRVLLENIFRLDADREEHIAPDGICPFLGQEAWVASDGRFNPCCAPDALRRTLGYFGNVNRTNLNEHLEECGIQGPAGQLHEERVVSELQHEASNRRMRERWPKYRISEDASHHVYRGQPAYEPRFHQVLKFHEPGLAPVLDGSGAYHIAPDGRPAYEARHTRTFGFYEGLAAVHAEDGWFHILPNGSPSYEERHSWCGNFQESRCAVRESDGDYLHIAVDGAPRIRRPLPVRRRLQGGLCRGPAGGW